MSGILAADAPRRIELRTPEGILLPFQLAAAGARGAAFLLDLGLIVAATAAAWLVAGLILRPVSRGLAEAFGILATFILFNFYFIVWEVWRSGVTPGKRRMRLRVISRDGGPLTTQAVCARNLTRDLELFLPLALFSSLGPAGIAGFEGLLTLLWVSVFALLPLLNKDRLRCGDLIAGTLVIEAPRSLLLQDLAAAPRVPAFAVARQGERSATGAEAISFTREQLDIYGIHELQVLEDLLHRNDQGTLSFSVLADVADKIKRKIDWPAEHWQVQAQPFLTAFYRAQRGRLEQRLLFGERRERKKG